MKPTPPSEAQLASLQTLYDALQILLTYNQTMHMPVAFTFLQIAENEGSIVMDLAQRLGTSETYMSVLTSDLGKSKRYYGGGLSLVEKLPVRSNRRKRALTLSATGKALRRNLAAVLHKKPKAPRAL